MLRDCITGFTTELYHGIMLRNDMLGSDCGIASQNDVMELYYGIIFMKRIPGMPRTSREPPGMPGILWARPWHPQGRSWNLQGYPLGPPGIPGTTQGRP